MKRQPMYSVVAELLCTKWNCIGGMSVYGLGKTSVWTCLKHYKASQESHIGNFPSRHSSGTVSHPHPLAGSAFLNNAALFYSTQGPSTNSNREEANHICKLHLSSIFYLMREWWWWGRRRKTGTPADWHMFWGLSLSLSFLTFPAGQNNVHIAFSLGILYLGNMLLFCAYCWSKSGTEGTLPWFIYFKKYQPNTKIWLTLPKSCPRQVQCFQLCLLQGFLWQVFISIRHKLMVLTEVLSSGNKHFSEGLGIEKMASRASSLPVSFCSTIFWEKIVIVSFHVASLEVESVHINQ